MTNGDNIPDDSGAIGLPFNGSLLDGDFTPLRPGDPLPDLPERWAILQGNTLVVRVDEDGQTLPEGDLPEWIPINQEPLCIGVWQGRLLKVLSLDKTTPLPFPFAPLPFHGLETVLDERLATLAGLAGQILYWERRSRFCSSCAGIMERIGGSWGKRCLFCGAEHFPHIHPCIIVLVNDGARFLLVRKMEWSSGRYSLIAGFLDFGESLEECVRREVREEAGVEVTNIRYVGSQNWPFPSQQMIGFVADYAGGEARGDGVETADARWFTAETLPRYPGSVRSISRWIFSNHATRRENASIPGTTGRQDS